MKKLLLTLLLALVSTSAFGISLKNAVVLGEQDDEGMKICSISFAPAIAAVEAYIRQNRLRLADKENAQAAFTIGMEGVPINQNLCAVGLSFRVTTNASIHDSGLTNHPFLGTVLLCSKVDVMTDETNKLQTRANGELRSMTEKCISEIEDIPTQLLSK